MYIYIIQKRYSNGAQAVDHVVSSRQRAEYLLERIVEDCDKDGWQVGPGYIPTCLQGEVVGDTWSIQFPSNPVNNMHYWIEKYKVS